MKSSRKEIILIITTVNYTAKCDKNITPDVFRLQYLFLDTKMANVMIFNYSVIDILVYQKRPDFRVQRANIFLMYSNQNLSNNDRNFLQS